MNSLPPRYPSNSAAPSLVDLSDGMASVKLQKLKFRSSNGDFLQPPHLVIDKIVDKPRTSTRNTAADNEDDKDSAAYEIAALKVELAKARTEVRHHARVALYLRRENRRLQLEVEAVRSNQIMFLEQQVGDGPFNSPTSVVPNDETTPNSIHDQAVRTLMTNICFLDLEKGFDSVDDNISAAAKTAESTLIGEDLFLSDDESSSY